METISATSAVIACSLGRDELEDVQAAWLNLFRTALVSREEVPGGVRLTVVPGAVQALRQLVEIERQCCRWISFVLDGPAVTLTAEGDGEQAIRAMWAIDQTGGE